ncbi:sialate O-acetylesterase [Maribacter sp. TH_r10]|uniref:sialate O-acetylesterase n=1 Tax=Maribacter sp. TH_r10 TaxID=3082086 RepID=UPI002952D782|nr:sialate O-acetylesterase [Maribacter sp. TH_r10]MDV7140471.1 sialate O-acetylesterase [Maribacter sp. TH_r10]
MFSPIQRIIVWVILFCVSQMFSQDPDFQIYICFGQSNMEGSATIAEQDKAVDDRFVMMPSMDCEEQGRTMGNWYPAVPPLSQCYVGLSPADYFGRTMVEKLPENKKVGVISVAVGGCDIRLFDKDIYKEFTQTYPEDWFQGKIAGYGGNPYDRLITLAKKAQKEGVIKGILLHQGETNTDDEKWPVYVQQVYTNMLNDLGLEASEVPLLAGEVVHEEQGGKCGRMNAIIDKLPETVPTAYVIHSKGCAVREDDIHFNSEGVREMGRRYAAQMLQLEGY